MSAVCVFCASSDKVPQKYKQVAKDLGAYLADKNMDVVYGGARSGLMGAMAGEALLGGAKVTGVLPEFLRRRERAHTGLSQLHITRDMQERQKMMADLSDAFIVMPGGLGTLAEFFEIITWRQVGIHNKPVIVLNAYGYWDPLLDMMKKAMKEKFLYQTPEAFLHICKNVDDIGNFLPGE